MKRKDLEDLGLSKEIIDSIMDINGKDIENAKKSGSSEVASLQAEITGLKEQLNERNSQLDTLKKDAKDNESLVNQIAELQKANKVASDKYANDLNNIKIGYEIDKALTSSNAKNLTAVKALLNMDNVKFDKEGKLSGLQEQIDALVSGEDTSFLFNTGNTYNFKGVTPAQASTEVKPSVDNDLKNMTYEQLCKYVSDNPDVKLG